MNKIVQPILLGQDNRHVENKIIWTIQNKESFNSQNVYL